MGKKKNKGRQKARNQQQPAQPSQQKTDGNHGIDYQMERGRPWRQQASAMMAGGVTGFPPTAGKL
jgi:hypothetical protein